MRLVTRADFDGLACGTILCRKGIVNDFMFVHPKNIQDNEVNITMDDVLTNVPYHENAGLWFDHHSSEIERVNPDGRFVGKCVPSALSCARIVYDYYNGEKTMPDLKDMITQVDRVDSAHLTVDDVMNPKGWVLLGFIMDPRTGLGRWHTFEIANRQLMHLLMTDLCSHGDLNYIFGNKHVKARVELYFEQQKLYEEMIQRHSHMEGNILIADLRDRSVIYSGNRFKLFAMYPECKASVTLMRGKGDNGCVVAVGSSIFNQCDFDIGSLMLKYNGGGHYHVGTCQFSEVEAPEIQEILDTLKASI